MRRVSLLSSRCAPAQRNWLTCLLGGLLLLDLACIGHRPRRCSAHTDCAADQEFCDTRGFCQQECSQMADCPCGSYCATGCGLCIRVDNRGPGTCFGVESGLGVQEVLGVCASFLRQDLPQQEDGGVCAPQRSDPLTCAAAAPIELVPDAGPAPQPEPAPVPMLDAGMP
jgi:hypothetical protein